MSRFLDELSVTPLADGRQWRLNSEFRYESGIAGLIIVPSMFTTDFASIPEMLAGIGLPAWQVYGAAAVVHDALYWIQDVTRETADDVLAEAMFVLGVDASISSVIHNAVRLCGQQAWQRNAELKASGYPRLASGQSLAPYAAP